MKVTTLVAPAVEPVGLAEAKDYLRVGFDGEDALIGDLIAAARGRIEALAGLALVERTLRVTLGCWPNGMVEQRWMRLPVRPAATLVAVRVFDAEGVGEDVTERFRIEAGPAAIWSWAGSGERGRVVTPGLPASPCMNFLRVMRYRFARQGSWCGAGRWKAPGRFMGRVGGRLIFRAAARY